MKKIRLKEDCFNKKIFSELSSIEIIIYLYLLSLNLDENGCLLNSPKIKEIELAINKSHATVVNGIKRLVKKEYILKRKMINVSGNINSYELNVLKKSLDEIEVVSNDTDMNMNMNGEYIVSDYKDSGIQIMISEFE